jgi:hypothetical protein
LWIPALPAAASQPLPAGQLTRIFPNFPNFVWDNYPHDGTHETYTINNALFIDPVNRLAFAADYYSYNDSPCANFVSYDIDTFAEVVHTCLPVDQRLPAGAGGAGWVEVTNLDTGSKAARVAVDPTDRLLFFLSKNKVAVVSEVTLKLEAVWDLPSGADGAISGLSWYAPGDELIVINSANNISVVDFDIKHSIEGGAFNSKGIVAWSASLAKACNGGLLSYYATASAYRSQNLPAVFVPCQVNNLVSQFAGDRIPLMESLTGVVKMELGGDGKPKIDSQGNPVTTAAISPDKISDLIFDPASDRGFSPVKPAGSGAVNVDIYDGARGEFAGRTAVGAVTNVNAITFNLDETSGRLNVTTDQGTTLIDGRRTPPSSTYYDSNIKGETEYITLPAIPPTKAHPYRRFLVNFVEHDPSNPNLDYNPYFAVIADTVGVTQDPAPAKLDEGTYQGHIPPGATVASTFGGSARGYGWHSDLVGGLRAELGNPFSRTLPTGGLFNNVPYAASDRDLLAAYVSKLDLATGRSGGAASALFDGNSATANDYSNGSTPTSKVQTQRQSWPYPLAECSQPGSEANSTGSEPGAYYTNSAGSTQQFPGSEKSADAQVNCLFTKATGASTLQASSLVTDGPALYMGYGNATTEISPPGTGGVAGVVSKATSTAKNIRIDLPGGASLSIGEVTQEATATAAGTAGTAHAQRHLTVSGISVNGASLCNEDCSQADFDQLNQDFPNRIHISRPDPYDVLYNGTPGGFTSGVQANLAQQYGDRSFNGMGAEEAAILPGLRIVLYNDGGAGLGREVLDLAGVAVDAHMGVDVIEGASTDTPLIDIGEAASAAGEPNYVDGGSYAPAAYSQANSEGSRGFLSLPQDIGNLVNKVFSGFKWLMQSPASGLRMLGTIALLIAPGLLMARRRLWNADPAQGAA